MMANAFCAPGYSYYCASAGQCGRACSCVFRTGMRGLQHESVK